MSIGMVNNLDRDSYYSVLIDGEKMKKTKQEIMALFQSDIIAKRQAIKEYFMDTSNSLDDRWEVYSETPKELQIIDSWINNDIDSTEFVKKYYMGEIDWYDTFNVDRHQTVKLMDLLERIDPESDHDLTTPEDVAELERIFKESVMSTGIHGFVNDW